MKIIVGLGNPGLQYARTRHNVGFCVTEILAEHLGISFSRRAFQSVTAEGRQAGEKVLLLQPQTFMNASGQAVLELSLIHIYWGALQPFRQAHAHKLPPPVFRIFYQFSCIGTSNRQSLFTAA